MKMSTKMILQEVKNHIVFTTIESLKFVLLTISMFFLIGAPMAYISIYVLKIDGENGEISAMITGIICAIIVVIIDHKKIHSLKKIHESRLKIWKMI